MIWLFSYRPIPIMPKPTCNKYNIWDFFHKNLVKKVLWLFISQYLWLSRYHFERKILGSWIAIWDISKIIFGSIVTYYYCFSISISYRYGNLYRLIPIRHFPYRQNRYIGQYWYIGRYRYFIGHTLKYLTRTRNIIRCID